MSRVKRGTTSVKHRKNVLSQVKGYRHGRSTKERLAREAIAHAGNHAFAHRRAKKGVFRRLWSVKINAALRAEDSALSYSKFIGALKAKNIDVNRKMFAEIAEQHPESFKRIVDQVK